ncbi:MAG: site-specific DNA-methyltransferase [Cytophagales bacterium]|nr:site-specific DNA-methyltransferase [Cytophagales bacterium]MDW8385162.1 DNA methyltransferase [Flammeovirgaceae bacterium]
MIKNKFNRLSSKEWLLFQKSWTIWESDEKLYADNICFFTKPEEEKKSVVAFWGQEESYSLAQVVAQHHDCWITKECSSQVQFAIADCRFIRTLEEYVAHKSALKAWLENLFELLEHRRFVCILISNVFSGVQYFPAAWDLALSVSAHFSLKDEKIICFHSDNLPDTCYALYFRKDEESAQKGISEELLFQPSILFPFPSTPHWFILKPAPRKKNEILHPAKYPEELVMKFVESFTQKEDIVFDPMSGTGSTQVGAIRLRRNAYGTELNEFFAKIANERIQAEIKNASFQAKVLVKDARKIQSVDFPMAHYMLTSPPYWDMLNMKGAENQQKRKQKGLPLNYSDAAEDLGNISEYEKFLTELVAIYKNLLPMLQPMARFTVVVKNIKKKGKNYPFAWDLAKLLSPYFHLQPEMFWLQDDLSIAPYGYGNTWVSNTFHQYCLHFVKK